MAAQNDDSIKYSQFKHHVVKAITAISFQQTDNVWVFETQADTCLTL